MYNLKQLYESINSDPKDLNEILSSFPKKEKTQYALSQIELLKERAKQYLFSPIPSLSFSSFDAFRISGDRMQYQASYFERRGRLMTFSLLAWFEPDNTKWLEALQEIIWAICAEPSWCIPAHFLDTDESPLPIELYATQLDLFSCETGFALAECFALCEELLPQRLVSFAKSHIYERILFPFANSNRSFRFEMMPNNWSAVCAGAIGGTALYMLDKSPLLINILHRALSSIELYLSSFGDDGICVEGSGYFSYGFGFFTCFADLLLRRSFGALNLFNSANVKAIAAAASAFFIDDKNTVSFSDGEANDHFRMGLLCYLNSIYEDCSIPNKISAMGILDDSCYRFCLSLRDFIWENENACFELPACECKYYKNAEWFISRTPSLSIAAKAGTNGESHNHNDCGSFSIYKNKVPLICDIGAGLYDAKYFSDSRYELFVCSSRSHNVALIDNIEQSFGEQFISTCAAALINEHICRFQMELSGCYEADKLLSYKRAFTHDIDEATLKLKDEFRFSSPTSITEVFLSLSPIEINGSIAIFKKDGVSLLLDFGKNALQPSLHEQSYFDHFGVECIAYLLHLKSVEQLEISIEINIK